MRGYGVFALLTGLVGYYSLLDLGLGQGVTKFVAEYKAKDDFIGMNYVINAAVWIQFIVGLVASSLLVIFADPILNLIRVSPQYWSDAKISMYAAAYRFSIYNAGRNFEQCIDGFTALRHHQHSWWNYQCSIQYPYCHSVIHWIWSPPCHEPDPVIRVFLLLLIYFIDAETCKRGGSRFYPTGLIYGEPLPVQYLYVRVKIDQYF